MPVPGYSTTLAGISTLIWSNRKRNILYLAAFLVACLIFTRVKHSQDSWAYRKWGPTYQHLQVHENVQVEHKVETFQYSHLIASVTMLYGNSEKDRAYQRAYRTHVNYASLHNYRFHTLKQPIANGYWSKTSYLLSLMLQELEKDPSEQVEWLMWFDSDTVLMNPSLPVDIFIPPFQREFEHVQLLVTKDDEGLNTGIMLLRVGQWSINFLVAALSFSRRDADKNLGASYDQKAMELLLAAPDFQHNATYVPKRWLNADVEQCQPGDLLVHFPGLVDRDFHMRYWLRRAEGPEKEQWNIPVEKLAIRREVEEFWELFKNNQTTSS